MHKFFYIFALAALVFAMLVPALSFAETPLPLLYCIQAGNTVDVAADVSGNIYLTEIGVGVHKLTYMGQPILTWGTDLFRTATGIVAGQDGYIYVCDLNNGMVRKFTQNGEHVLSWAIPVFANMSEPYGIDQAPNGEIYVCDPGQAQILIFTPEGELLRHWSCGESGMGIGVAVDKNGLLVYVGKRGANVVDVFDTLGNPIRTWTVPGAYNLDTDNGGYVYVATNSTTGGVQKYDRYGVLQYSLTEAYGPCGVAVNPWGWVYATNSGYLCAFGDPATPTTKTTWGQLKSLYH